LKLVFSIFFCLSMVFSTAQAETETETINKCLADLSSSDVKVRRRAVLILCKFTHNHVYSRLIPLLQDPDDKVRQSIVVGFIESRIMLREGALPLVRCLADVNVHTRRMVSSALLPRLSFYISYGDPLAAKDKKILMGALRDKDSKVRKNMLTNYYSLNRILEPSSFYHLLGDDSSEIRLAALSKLSDSLSYKGLKPYLDKLVKDKSVKIREQVLKNLGNFGREGRAFLDVMAEDKEPAIAARAMAYTRNHDYLTRLKKMILDEGSSSDLVIDVTMAIANWNEDSNKFTYSLLSHADETRRFAALNAIARMGKTIEIKQLLNLVKDDASRIRKLIFRHLIRLKMSEGTVSELALSEYPDVRQFTMNYILRNYQKNAAILEALYDLILDEELKIRVLAIKAIWQCKTEDRYDILEQSLTDNEAEIRNLAAQLLLSSTEAKAKKIMDAFMKKDKKLDIAFLQELNKLSSLKKLSKTRTAGWRKEISKALNHKSMTFKKAALDIIITTRDPQLVNELRNYLDTNRDTELQNYLYKRIAEEEN
jgi:HEAT repeat protein